MGLFEAVAIGAFFAAGSVAVMVTVVPFPASNVVTSPVVGLTVARALLLDDHWVGRGASWLPLASLSVAVS